MMPAEEVEAAVAAGKAEVAEALAAQPYTPTPQYGDLMAAAEAILRFMIRGPEPSADPPGEPAQAADDSGSQDAPPTGDEPPGDPPLDPPPPPNDDPPPLAA